MFRKGIAKSRVCLLFLVAGVLFMSGCGGSSSDSNASSPSANNTPAPTAEPTATPEPSVSATPTPAPTLAPSPTPIPNTPVGNPDDPFHVSTHSPINGTENRALVSTVDVEFNKPLVPATAIAANVDLKTDDRPVAFTLSYEEGSTLFQIIPQDSLEPNRTYIVELHSQLMSEDGELLSETTWAFTTTGNLGDTLQSTIDSCMSQDDIDMLDAVNEVRSEGYSCASGNFPATYPLTWDCKIALAADRHSSDMANNNFFEHTGSDGSSAGDRISQAEYSWQSWAENIAAGQRDIPTVVQAWLTSETGHCKNIMSSSLTEFGSSLVTAPPGSARFTRYWTQNFARPRN